jgi:GTP-binding protein EngB required for normal cell division
MDTLYSYIYNDEKKGIDSISDDILIQTINKLRDLGIDIDFPKICVVGTQSSGKSSLLNSIINKNILPVGTNMVTRTPLDIRLIKTLNKEKIEIDNNIFEDECDYEKIGKVIDNITDDFAGCHKAVSNKPIIMNIYNKHLHNLSLIDLPGLTMVACTDKGQPANIKQQIRELISEYIKDENTIILAVMAARSDLEADIGLDMIKEYDPDGKRTLGVITKVDLMNDNNDIGDYLENNENISKDLMLYYGYHAIMNKGSIEDEKKYFNNHKKYSKLDTNHFGIGELIKKIRNILIDKIKKNIPDIKKKLNKLENNINTRLKTIGNEPPINANDKKSFIQSEIIKINETINKALTQKGFSINTGTKIKNEFIRFREELVKHNNNYGIINIENALKNCEGNHMSYSISPIEILEYCIQSDKLIGNYLPISVKCIKNIKNILYELILITIKDLERFPDFYNFLKTKLTEQIDTSIKITILKINEIINMEENYIWTDDKDFVDELQNIKVSDKNCYNKLINMYLSAIVKIFQNTIPKCIMFNVVSILQIKMCENNVSNDVSIDEKPEIENERKECLKIKQIIVESNKYF